jgi:hypothetical protein
LVDLSDTEQAALDDLVFQVAPPEAPRVVVPYVARYLRREVEETLRTSVWTAFIDVEGDTAYFDLMAGLWAAGDTIIVVEHDDLVQPKLLREMWACSEPWCTGAMEDGSALTLGCTKFSSKLVAMVPDAMDRALLLAPTRQFRLLDRALIWKVLEEEEGLRTHLHPTPPVVHLHPPEVSPSSPTTGPAGQITDLIGLVLAMGGSLEVIPEGTKARLAELKRSDSG